MPLTPQHVQAALDAGTMSADNLHAHFMADLSAGRATPQQIDAVARAFIADLRQKLESMLGSSKLAPWLDPAFTLAPEQPGKPAPQQSGSPWERN